MPMNREQIPPRARRRWILAGVVSLIFWVLLETLVPGAAIPWTPAMRGAARRMEAALAVTAQHCREARIPLNGLADPNGTCLVGPELSELFTSTGQLEAKRTTTNPDMAALIAHFLSMAGVAAGDTVAVAASGSFPGLMVATLVAVEAMGAMPMAILSPGASSWGATRPEFDLLDLHHLLQAEGVFEATVAAASLGGTGDTGREFEPEVRSRLARKIADRGIRFLSEPDLRVNVSERMRIYGRPAAFVNIGGNEASIGTSPEILNVPAGLSLDLADRLILPPIEQRGVLFAMAAARVPVVHLLHVRALALRFGIAWDPVPLPGPGTTRLKAGTGSLGTRFWLLTLLWLVALGMVSSAGRSRTPAPAP